MSHKKKAEKLSKELEEMAFEEELVQDSVTASETAEPTDAEKIKALAKDCAEWKDKYLRSMAEFENYRRRSIQEKSDWIKLSTQKLALEICDVADNFERALMQVPDSEKENSFVKGVLMIEQQLRSVLEKEGVRKIDALGKEFDPGLHEALAHIPSDYEENMVAAVIQNGYTMHDKLLRPVRVAVSSEKIKPNPEKPESASQTGADDGKSGIINVEIK